VTDAVNIASYLTRSAAASPHELAIVCPTGRRRPEDSYLTRRQLDQESDAVARGLELAGIGRGVRTVLMVRPSPELFTLAFAMLKVGAVPVLIDPGIGRRHLAGCISTAAPQAFVGVAKAHLARMVFGWGRRTVRELVTVGPWAPWGGSTLGELTERGRMAGSFTLAETAADETAAIVFTSGSTGPPKGVVYSHGNFRAQLEAVRELLGVASGDVDLPTFPLFALFDPALGMTTVVPEMDPTRPGDVDPLKILEPIAAFKVTTMFGSPALLDRVGRYGAARGVRLPSLKRVISAGAPVSPQIIQRFQEMLEEDGEILTPYGATECLPVAVISSREILAETRRATDSGAGVCVGLPVPSVDVAIIPVSDEPVDRWNGTRSLPPGEVGEIVVKGGQVTTSYFRAEHQDRLAKIADSDGAVRHRMGDLGYWDADGRLWFVGRKSHRVEIGDTTLYPVRCEGVFNTHPAVRRSALVGVGREAFRRPVVCLELEPEARTVDRGRLYAELTELAAGHEVTRGIDTFVVRRRFPVDIRHNAKIDRPQLAEWAERKLGLSG